MNKHVDTKWPWYAVQTDPMAEIKAARELKLGGYEAYCPTWRKEYRHHRTKKWTSKEFALFGRYVFIRLAADLGGLETFDGVQGLLRTKQGFAVPIDEDEMARLKRLVDTGVLDQMRDHGLKIKPGPVRIEEGQFVGLVGLLESVKDAGRARVLVEILGRSVPTEIEVENLVQV
jgi:transcriptional antiterminator RfaH